MAGWHSRPVQPRVKAVLGLSPKCLRVPKRILQEPPTLAVSLQALGESPGVAQCFQLTPQWEPIFPVTLAFGCFLRQQRLL